MLITNPESVCQKNLFLEILETVVNIDHEFQRNSSAKITGQRVANFLESFRQEVSFPVNRRQIHDQRPENSSGETFTTNLKILVECWPIFFLITQERSEFFGNPIPDS